MTSYLTAEHMLNRAVVTADETVLVSGVSGGVGSARVQLALLRGAKVVAVVGKYKEEPLKALGVHGIIFRDEKDYQGTVQNQLPLSPVDVVADVVGGNQAPRLIDLIRLGGRYVTAGAIAGPMVTIDWRKIYLKHLTLIGSTMGTRQESKRIVDLVASGRLKPLLARVYPLSKLVQAQKDFKKKAHFGKLVVVP